MKQTEQKNIGKKSLAETLADITESLAFEVKMIMWEDKQDSERTERMVKVCARG